MASMNAKSESSLYPEAIQSKPEPSAPLLPNPNPHLSPSPSSSSYLYPSLDPSDFAENLIPYYYTPSAPSAPPMTSEEVLLKIPGAILNLIDQQYSVKLACGDFTIIRLCQDGNTVVALARVADEIQWALAKDTATVKVDDSHYFFSFHFPGSSGKEGVRKGDDVDDVLSYGLTIASKGQESLLKELDEVLKTYSSFSVQEVSENAKKKGEAMDASVAKEISPAELNSGKKMDFMEDTCAAYWTTIAPNVEEYSGTAARLIAQGSGQLIKGILWCGDVTAERLKAGNEVMKARTAPCAKAEVSPETLNRIRRVKKVTETTEKVANGILSGVMKVSGLFASSVAKSKTGKKIIGLLPAEVILASLDGFVKMCDAVEVSGKHVMSTSSTVTTDYVNHRYGEEASKATGEGFDAAGHALGAVWAAYKTRKALYPKSLLKPAFAKSAAQAAAAQIKEKEKKKGKG